jgi:HEAT repeat protein
MNHLLELLSGGDVRSDGQSDEVAALVLDNPALIDDLVEGLTNPDKVIRGRTTDALEKIAREKPALTLVHLPRLIEVAQKDPLPVVKMHLAMIFGHLVLFDEALDDLLFALLALLEDPSVFVRSWTISSLCLIARRQPATRDHILWCIVPLQDDPSVAIRSRAQKAVRLLSDERTPFPKGWIKSVHLQDLG